MHFDREGGWGYPKLVSDCYIDRDVVEEEQTLL